MFTQKKILVIALAIAIFLIVLFSLLLKNNSSMGGAFTFVSAQPAQNVTQVYIPVQEVSFTFSSPIDPAQVYYTTSPTTETFIRLTQPNVLIISPRTVWKTGITTITIQTATKGKNGQSLTRPITYQFKTAFPTNDHPDHPLYDMKEQYVKFATGSATQ